MKRSLIIILLLCFPTVIFAKYCPACLQTYQAQSIRGQAKLVYQWSHRIIKSKKMMKLSDFKQLFDRHFRMVVNGKNVARGVRGTYRYFYSTRRKSKLLESRLNEILVDQNKAALAYQTITKRRNGGKYRSLVITILTFKHHKVDNWKEVSYSSRIK